ncbi:MAG TPA: hypothetical protein VFU64_09240 [Gaiellaceae bacterium]|nr:hypothetical protein [Gaiellaceae bacterium]
MKRLNLGSAVLIAAAALVVGAVFGRPGSGEAAGTAVPTNTAPPTISGTAQQNETLSATTGTWTDNPTSYAFAWNRCDTKGANCVAISGASASTYKLVADDVGHTLTVTVTASNGSGSAQATSAATAVVSAAAAPKNSKLPTISGSAQVGSSLTASPGEWTGNPTSFAYAWSHCDAKGANCAAISGATNSTYTVTAADAGATLLVSVTATNNSGSTKANSAATAVVPSPNGCPAGTGTIQIADLKPPARLQVSKASITPKLVTLATHTIQLHFKITACNGRPVQGATVFATPIPYNQFAGNDQTTGATGTVSITEKRLAGFPARTRKHQHLLAVFARASKPGDPILGGVSTRRTVAFQVNLP